MASEDKKNTIEEKKEEYKELKGLGFFKKVKYSIFNIEKYPELATEGIGKALTYIAKLVVILAVVLLVTPWPIKSLSNKAIFKLVSFK